MFHGKAQVRRLISRVLASLPDGLVLCHVDTKASDFGRNWGRNATGISQNVIGICDRFIFVMPIRDDQ